jgi:serine protease AprX
VGVAPNVNLLGVKVSDATGQARMSSVIAGLAWVVNNKDKYNIRVVNLSLVSSVAESYRTSELDAAVEMAWLKGVVVVVAAGNTGPNTMLYAPANDPYVITVGAADDQGTLGTGDDRLAPFSAYGTSADGIAKPELVAPGRRIVSALYSTKAPLAQQFPDRITSNGLYIRLSGTSASAPIVSGIVADLLQANPSLTPDQVKWLLMQTALPIAGPGTGAGYPQAAAAVAYRGAIGQANVGVVPNDKIAAAGCATLAGCNAATNWNTVSWNTVSWNTVSWNTVSWNTVSWNVAWEVVPTD